MHERQKFEENWKQAFEGAEMAPSEHVWANVELDLAADENLRMKKRVVFYQRMAAGLVLLCASLGTYVWINRPTGQSLAVVTETQQSQANNQRGSADQQPAASPTANPTQPNVDARTTTALKATRGGERSISLVRVQPPADVALMVGAAMAATDSSRRALSTTAIADATQALSDAEITEAQPTESVVPEPQVVMTEEEALQVLNQQLAVVDETKQENRSVRESAWLAMGAAAGSYNPSTAAGSGQQDAAFGKFSDLALANQQNDRAEASRSSVGAAYSVGVSVGKKIAKRWMVQGGINYVNQQIDYTSNIRTYDASNSQVVFIPDYGAKMEATSAPIAAVTQSPDYTINSAIEMISLPVQAGYLIIDRKLGWQVNGGVASDFFVRNTLIDESGQAEKFSRGAGKDSPYRTVNLSGVVNTELSYLIGRHYRVALVPGIRYSFTSILKEGTSTPLVADIGFRFRYLFNPQQP
jgi:hypothetical protein